MKFINWTNEPERLKEKLKQLSPDSKPKWGRMDAHQMIEHLILIFEMSNGTKIVEVLTPEKYIDKTQAFLLTDQEMPKNYVAEFIPKDPIPYKYSNLNIAIDALSTSIEKYHSYWGVNCEDLCSHPVFGRLNKNLWNRLHNKHITHHLLQFGINL